jgi:hypothetical protein
MLVICIGLKRAASTLQYQLCRELLGINNSITDYGYTSFQRDIIKAFNEKNGNKYSIIKTHNYFDILKEYDNRSDVLLLSSYRDLRDSSVSQMLAYKKTYAQLIKGKWLESEMNTFYKLKSINNILIQDYTKLTNDIENSILEIAAFLKINVDDVTLNNIIQNFSKEAQQQKIDNYNKTVKSNIVHIINKIVSSILPVSFLNRGIILNIDKSTSLHYNHINKNRINWESYYSNDQKKEIKSIIGDWLIEVGIEKDYNW